MVEVVPFSGGSCGENLCRQGLSEKTKTRRCFLGRDLGFLAGRDVANVALNDVLTIDLVCVADELDLGTGPSLGFEREILITDVAIRVQPFERRFALVDVVEQTDLPKLLPDELLERVAEQLDDEWVGVDDLAAVAVENQDGILCRLEEPPIAGLGGLDRKRRSRSPLRRPHGFVPVA